MCIRDSRYREQKDKLEYEAMMRNPETAYLVSNEEFDKQLEELGLSLIHISTARYFSTSGST